MKDEKNGNEPQIIELFKCASCGRQVYEDEPDLCKCGSNEYKYLQPHFMARAQYCIHKHGILKGIWMLITTEVLPAAPEPRYKLPR